MIISCEYCSADVRTSLYVSVHLVTFSLFMKSYYSFTMLSLQSWLQTPPPFTCILSLIHLSKKRHITQETKVFYSLFSDVMKVATNVILVSYVSSRDTIFAHTRLLC